MNWHHHIKGHVEIGYLTKFGSLRLNRNESNDSWNMVKVHTNVCNFVTASPTYKLLIFFTISVIFPKMSKHSNFRISFLQVVDAWRILQFDRKTEKYFKDRLSLYGFGGRYHKIIETFVWIFNHVSRVITWSLFNLRAPNLVKLYGGVSLSVYRLI